MKVSVACKSPLLQKSLELFLDKYLSIESRSDIIVRDVECLNNPRCFYISSDTKADLVKPFSKSQLVLALEKKYDDLGLNKNKKDENQGVKTQSEILDFSILERRIESLTQEYQSNIIRAVKAFYEK